MGPALVYYIPILTTVVAVMFAVVVLRRYRERHGMHLLWWGVGMITYGVGTFTEAFTTLFGWNAAIFRAWYIAGALLGGAPLAQGTVYLMLPRRTAHRLTALLLAFIAVASVCVLLSPVTAPPAEAHRLTGRVFGWQWVRAFSPFINLYAVVFLIGGAVLSAVRYWRRGDSGPRATGNGLIALGALLPGIGGGFTRFGHVEVLYATEFVGLLLIFAGYRLVTGSPVPTIHQLAVN